MTVASRNGEFARRIEASGVGEARRVTITPKMAEQLLSKNTLNRAIIESHLASLEQVLLRGEWAFNGESIIISITGKVLDGQHRLWACVNTGVPIDTIIVYGVDEAVFGTIDGGKSRTIGNVLSIHKEENYNNVAAAVKVFYGFVMSGGEIYDGGGFASSFTATTAKSVLEANPGIRDSVRVAIKCNHYRSKSLLGALHYILGLADKGAADDLVSVLASGARDTSRPFNVLREHVIYSITNRTPMNKRALAAKTIRAFNAEVTGERLVKFAWRSEGNFPTVVGLDYESLGKMM